MGLLRPLIDFKDKLMELLLTDERVVSLIDDQEYNTVPAIGLRYKKVFPYAYVPQTIDDASTIVCFETTISSVYTDAACDVQLTIWVMTHTSIIRTEKGCRNDVLADAIDDLINHQREFGIGKLTPVSREPVSYTIPNYDYVCRKLSYSVPNFNFRLGARD